MRRTAITVNYLQMLCLLKVPSSFFVGVLLSSIRLLGCLFTSLKSCLACCVVYSLTSSKIYFDFGVAWLVGLLGLLRGDLCFFLSQFL